MDVNWIYCGGHLAVYLAGPAAGLNPHPSALQPELEMREGGGTRGLGSPG